MIFIFIVTYVAYTAAQYTYLSMASSVMYIIRSVVQYFVPSLLIVISVYSLELLIVEKNVTLLYTVAAEISVSSR